MNIRLGMLYNFTKNMLLKKQLHDVSTVVVSKSNCYPLSVGRVRASVRDVGLELGGSV